ncbi:hypothetical protein OF846_002086 [Rhodotorula toruloides]|nr:hypothetical protein OF846_002086 [Rhodotorula toruloides]
MRATDFANGTSRHPGSLREDRWQASGTWQVDGRPLGLLCSVSSYPEPAHPPAQASPDQADQATLLFEQIQQYLEDLEASIDGLKADKASLEVESQAAATKAAAADADAQAKERALLGREQELDESRDCCARLEGLVSRLNGLVQGLAGDVAKEVGEFDLPTLRIASAAAPAASPTGAGADTVALA